jgi:hypothetical protein
MTPPRPLLLLAVVVLAITPAKRACIKYNSTSGQAIATMHASYTMHARSQLDRWCSATVTPSHRTSTAQRSGVPRGSVYRRRCSRSLGRIKA